MMEKDRQVGSNVSLDESLAQKRDRRKRTENRGRHSILFFIELIFHFAPTTANDQAE